MFKVEYIEKWAFFIRVWDRKIKVEWTSTLSPSEVDAIKKTIVFKNGKIKISDIKKAEVKEVKSKK